jgi:outer membrane protein assembly factor BamE (lipoprotein component of BamABCDE complex)
MTRRTKIISIVVFLVFFALSSFTVLRICTPFGVILSDMAPSKKKEYQQIKQNIRKIKIGMNREQVKEIMGAPQAVGYYDHFESWHFPDYKTASEPSSCDFDINTGQVVYVVSGDDYHIGNEK